MTTAELPGWDRLRHGGLLLDTARLRRVAAHAPKPLAPYHAEVLRRLLAGLTSKADGDSSAFITFVLEIVCGFSTGHGSWLRGTQIGTEWSRRAVTGESVRPRQLWQGDHGAILPVFIDDEPRLGVGRGRRSMSLALQWLRAGTERLALLTNGRQWRLVFAGLDFEAWCEWDIDLWLEEGAIGAQLHALRTLLAPAQFIPPGDGAVAPLLDAILESRKGQSELSAALGERVREAVELLVQAHSTPLAEQCADVDPAEIYRAAVRVVMRMVVVLFAESRDLLPRDNALYHGTYGLGGMLSTLERTAARGGLRLRRQYTAWPRVLALFKLVHEGSHHPALPVPAYGGDLFNPAATDGTLGIDRALSVFEKACFDREIVSDHDVLVLLERLTRTRVKVRQGRAAMWVSAPVDFSDLSSEYIGILYEGLLDFELRTAPAGDPVIFLSVGNQPALPLSRLEAMTDAGLVELLDAMKDTSTPSDEGDVASEAAGDAAEINDEAVSADEASTGGDDEAVEEEAAAGEDTASDAVVPDDARLLTRSRAELWARRAVAAGGLVPKLRGAVTPEKLAAHEAAVARKAKQLVTRVVLPGERFLVRWGGTRKGSGSFYTRPGLAVPLVQRTLRPLAYDPPMSTAGTPDIDAPAAAWTPKRPEEILALSVCDPACGSGTFPVGALRFLTDALYASLHHHGRISMFGDQALIRLLNASTAPVSDERLGDERLPCRPDDPTFEPRLKAVLRRYVVERCIYGVDLDPLAVELCRLALWIETMDRTLPFSFLDHKIKCGNGLIGAWFDQFQHYPAMAWKHREGGDKGHANGVHFAQDARGKAIKAWTKDVLTLDLQRFLSGRTLFDQDMMAQANEVHAAALTTLAALHDLPVQDAAERSKRYREELLGAPAWQRLKGAMDLWCACWFWPADRLDVAPLPSTFAVPSEQTLAVAREIAERKRFFHWELEFPDVFSAAESGFSAILGNPPWETLQPASKEFFSNLDPLFRAYGKQDALLRQKELFESAAIEGQWLDYCASFAEFGNFMKYAAMPFGDPKVAKDNGDRFSVARGGANETFHQRWRDAREHSRGYATSVHPFTYRGEGKAYTYKLFLEQAHALLVTGGRLGFIVPSGLYSDHGSAALRTLFLDHCRWEWLFGFENRESIFDIHRSFKFNPLIIEKGGRTEAIRTAFMRRSLREWEQAEQIATSYTRAQVERFSPRSRAILEVESARDLEILEKIYANSVLLGDDAPDGWGVKYAQGDFNMTSDSKLFPPRPKWEAQGYRPDEYSRWLKGNWRPISELWPELGVDPAQVVPAEMVLEEWLFDSSAGPDERTARAQFVHGYLLKPGDVQRTPWRLRCAQPPYDALPIPRADIPAGIILSREADAWVREGEVEDVALPLYEGRMIGQFDFSQKGWVSGKGRGAKWRDIDFARKQVEPQYCMGWTDYVSATDKDDEPKAVRGAKIAFMDVTSATNERTMIATVLYDQPCGNSAPVLATTDAWSLVVALNSLVYDFVARRKCGGLHLNWFVVEDSAVPQRAEVSARIAEYSRRLIAVSNTFAVSWLSEGDDRSTSLSGRLAVTRSERVRLQAIVDAIHFAMVGIGPDDARHVLTGADEVELNNSLTKRDAKGFWRVDSNLNPELRRTILTLIALEDLSLHIGAALGDRLAGVEAFLSQRNGEGWLLPETVRLSDYGLGQGSRATEHQYVASTLGPRFLDWQLSQSAAESWRECEIHARNLRVGLDGGRRVDTDYSDSATAAAPHSRASRVAEPSPQTSLFG